MLLAWKSYKYLGITVSYCNTVPYCITLNFVIKLDLLDSTFNQVTLSTIWGKGVLKQSIWFAATYFDISVDVLITVHVLQAFQNFF